MISNTRKVARLSQSPDIREHDGQHQTAVAEPPHRERFSAIDLLCGPLSAVNRDDAAAGYLLAMTRG
jgi:hypothetical protein